MAQLYWLRIVIPVILSSSIHCCSMYVGWVSHFYHYPPKFQYLKETSWDISNDFRFHSNLFIHIGANNVQDYIKPFSIHGWRKILFSWPNRDIIFLLSSWDIAFSFERLHRFELGAIRFPLIFFNSNTWYWDEKKAKVTNFIELAILEFGCPKRTHNTNSTRLPLNMNAS